MHFLREQLDGAAVMSALTRTLLAASTLWLASCASLPVPPGTIVPTDNVGGISPAPPGGSFTVGADGAATFSYPLWAPPGRKEIQPQLAVTYHSRHENGMLGVGWYLNGLSTITRCKRDMARDLKNAAILFTADDAFCLDGLRLVSPPDPTNLYAAVCGPSPEKEFRVEDEHFIRVISGQSDSNGPLWFEADFKDGRIFCYGVTADSRLEGHRFHSFPTSLSATDLSSDNNQVVRLTWALSDMRDRYGNQMTVQYSVTGDPVNQIGLEQLPESIQYTGTIDNSLAPQRRVDFVYDTRPDVESVFISGLMLQRTHRLKEIRLTAPNPVTPGLLKRYAFTYDHSGSTGRSILIGISECDANNVCLVPTTFGYSSVGPGVVPPRFLDVDTGIHDDSASGSSTVSAGPTLGHVVVGDFNGDGCDDFIYTAYGPPEQSGEPSLVQASYRLSACFDAIKAGAPAFTAPGLFDFTDKLSPFIPFLPFLNGPNTNIPPYVFDKPQVCCDDPGLQHCGVNVSGPVCRLNQFLAVDLDLDGRADLVAYNIIEDNPNAIQQFTTSVYLASSIPPVAWTPQKPIFRGSTVSFVELGAALPSNYYGSILVGDINGDGYPDLIKMWPTGWAVQLNHGATFVPISPVTNIPQLTSACGDFGSPCLNLDADFGVFPVDLSSVVIPFAYVLDIDHDGTSELLVPDPMGPNWYASFSLDAQNNPRCCPNLALVSGNNQSPPRRDWFVDLNGDGLPDVVSIPVGGGGPFVSLNSGNGFTAPQQQMLDVPVPSDGLLIADLFGAGSQQLLFAAPEGLRALVASPTGVLSSVPLLAHTDPAVAPVQIQAGSDLQALDADGDGMVDLIQTINGTAHVYLREGGRPDLIGLIDDRGARTFISYAPISSATVYSTTVPPGVLAPGGSAYLLNRGLWVVSRYATSRAGSFHQGPLNSYSVTYQDGRTDLAGRGFMGFGSVSIADQQTGAVTRKSYDNQFQIGSAYPFAGRAHVQNEFVRLSDSGFYHQTRNEGKFETFGASSGSYWVTRLAHSTTREFEGAAALTLNATIQPFGDPGTINLQIDGVSYANDVRVSGTTGTQALLVGTHAVGWQAQGGTDPSSYVTVFGGDCDAQGKVSLAVGDNKTCTVTLFGQEPVSCYVFDDGYTNIQGPSQAIFISHRSHEEGKACIPDSGPFGTCRKWFGRCFTVLTGAPVFMDVFDDGFTNAAGPSDAIFVQGGNSQACVPDTGSGTCRKWFGTGTASDGRPLVCQVFDDGGGNATAPSNAIFVPNPDPSGGSACVPGGSNGVCRRWFGQCQVK